MWWFALTLLILSGSALPGCARTEGIAHYAHDYVLEVGGLRDAAPKDFPGEPFRLVEVAEDGTATIEATATGERFSARPSGYFNHADGTRGPWGTSGLQLLAAERQTGVACVRRRTARDVMVRR